MLVVKQNKEVHIHETCGQYKAMRDMRKTWRLLIKLRAFLTYVVAGTDNFYVDDIILLSCSSPFVPDDLCS